MYYYSYFTATLWGFIIIPFTQIQNLRLRKKKSVSLSKSSWKSGETTHVPLSTQHSESVPSTVMFFSVFDKNFFKDTPFPSVPIQLNVAIKRRQLFINHFIQEWCSVWAPTAFQKNYLGLGDRAVRTIDEVTGLMETDDKQKYNIFKYKQEMSTRDV